ncbi:MerR family transcriptional regulator [Candidatus Enterococcus murrayae]|uniref:MerR family transcriptional regulator n=1 Tax=Candidatus Enterococcus murrayae TaxID=2815321 RepID=A0ABS3HIE5_9ENTE|nr:MerR family transcriptional regulator [Enterococcus sp. MJM16]MBO0453236.1 MerR family transcriptional regulator [Enterococcus sp. MJM16]
MNYTIKQMAELSGVSTRTLRFYDERDLLKPAFLSEAGYRMYTEKEVDRLQQILLYRSLGVPLKTIRGLINRPAEKIQQTLLEQRVEVVKKRNELDQLLEVLDKTLLYYKGEIEMTAEEKFDAFKKKAVLENEEKYGQEIREKYGEEAVEASNQKWLGMTELDYQKMEETEATLFSKLTQYLAEGKLPSPLAEEIVDLHKTWLQFSWKKYTKEIHRGLTEMYLGDERFTRYYDEKCGVGATEALCQIIQYYTS